MNRIILNHCRCIKKSTILWENRQYQNFPYITLSRSLSYYTTQPLGLQHDIAQKPLNARFFGHGDYVRTFSTSQYYFEKEPLKPSSKVEATVVSIKKEIEENEKLPKKVEKKKSLKERIMAELRHYYHGFRLLFIEIRISSVLLMGILKGNTLTRREHRLLVTTIGDLFRMVPFIVFIAVPFLEFALPIFIKLFPNMLPSTFESRDQRDAKLKQHLKVKLEMAKFFQETLDQMAPQAGERHSDLAKEFSTFFNKIRTSGDVATSEEIMKFSKLFEDEITLDSLQRPHLVALCKVLQVSTIGTSAMLRFNLKMKLRSLAADDKMIAKEGVDSLNFNELQQACRARGMRAYGVSEERLRKELRNWLDLSLNERVPPSLLLLSRALMVPEHVPTTYKLKATISALPDTVATHTKAAIGEKEGKVDFKAKAEAIKLEELRIKEERKETEEAEREKQILEAKKREKEELKDKAPIIDIESEGVSVDPAPIIAVDPVKPKPEKSEEGLSGKDIEVIEDALEKLAQQKKSLLLEKESIQDMKTELLDYSEDVKEMQEIVKTKQADIKLTKGARRLYSAVNNMIGKLDSVLVELENKEKALKTTLEQTKHEPQKAKEHLIQLKMRSRAQRLARLGKQGYVAPPFSKCTDMNDPTDNNDQAHQCNLRSEKSEQQISAPANCFNTEPASSILAVNDRASSLALSVVLQDHENFEPDMEPTVSHTSTSQSNPTYTCAENKDDLDAEKLEQPFSPPAEYSNEKPASSVTAAHDSESSLAASVVLQDDETFKPDMEPTVPHTNQTNPTKTCTKNCNGTRRMSPSILNDTNKISTGTEAVCSSAIHDKECSDGEDFSPNDSGDEFKPIKRKRKRLQSISSTGSSSSDKSSSSSSSSSSSCKTNVLMNVNENKHMEHDRDKGRSSEHIEISSSPVKKGKRKTRNPHVWKRNTKKLLKNTGKEYISSSGKTVDSKCMRPPCTDKCRLYCSKNLPEETRKQIFKSYWELGLLQRQRDFLSSCITPLVVACRRIRMDAVRPRKPNCGFYFVNDGKNVRVCKTFLLNTLGIAERTLRTVIDAKVSDVGITPQDKRGKHGKQVKIDSEIKESVRLHINSIPRVDSHYLRANTSREFIDGGLTIAELHRLYKEVRASANKEAATYDTYARIFNTEFNISFFFPKKDQCDLCEAYKNSDEEGKKKLEQNYQDHLKQKELSRIEKSHDITLCLEPESNLIVAIYDLQAVMPVPLGESSAFFYKSKLNCYNFTIDELMHSIKSLQKVPDEAKLKMIQDVLGRLDDDFDGQLKIDDVLKLLEFIGNENVNLSEKQMAELIDLLDKEEILEVESRIQKALDKAAAQEQVKSTESEGRSLFDIIREAQKRREQKKAMKNMTAESAIPKSEEIVKPPQPESSKRPETQ